MTTMQNERKRKRIEEGEKNLSNKKEGNLKF